MNNASHARMDPAIVKDRFGYARRHSEFAATLFKMQVKEGRYCVHEHPRSVSSWQDDCINEVPAVKGVQRVIGDQCQYGSKAKGTDGEGPARKTTGFMTSPPCKALQLQRRCPIGARYKVHKHVQMDGGRAKAAQVYPPELCRVVCRGLIKHMALSHL